MSTFDRILDAFVEGRARDVARRTDRRNFLGRLGTLLVGGAALPLLPIRRAAAQSTPSPRILAPSDDIPGPEGDEKSCDYWRHCAIDGSLCACCGGSAITCPPGTEVTPVTWVGTCRNPSDGKDYLISYNDCCGKSLCGRCVCNRNEGERPEYHWYRNNDINWCAGATSEIYNCSIAVVVGQATEPQPER
jgi:methylamine dehydrogenase light chain